MINYHKLDFIFEKTFQLFELCFFYFSFVKKKISLYFLSLPFFICFPFFLFLILLIMFFLLFFVFSLCL